MISDYSAIGFRLGEKSNGGTKTFTQLLGTLRAMRDRVLPYCSFGGLARDYLPSGPALELFEVQSVFI